MTRILAWLFGPALPTLHCWDPDWLEADAWGPVERGCIINHIINATPGLR